MSQLVIEGTWEEIERRKAELIGRQLRVIVKADTAMPNNTHMAANTAKRTPARKLVGFGAFKDSLPSTEEYIRDKQLEIEREDRTS